jgi:hypothetical protein
MKRTFTVFAFFLAALLAGLYLSYWSTTPVTKETEQTESKETFAQRQVGMPLDMQSAEGATGVSGYSGTPPLLGSEPKPVSDKPYEMANDNELFQFEGNRVSADCCPSPFSGDRGCVCLTSAQIKEFQTRGGNASV